MVAAKQGNIKQKNMHKPGNIRKFKQGQMGFKQQQMHAPRNGRQGAMFHPNQLMDNPNQMMDNPGYMDFNEPPMRQQPPQKLNHKIIHQNGNGMKMNRPRGRRPNMQHPPQQMPLQRNGGGNQRWGQSRPQPNGKFQGGSNGAPFRGPNGPRMHPMQPPMHHGEYPPPQFYPQRFGPGPMMPPPPPMGPMMGPPMCPPMGRPGGPRRPIGPPGPPFRNNGAPGPRANIRRGKAPVVQRNAIKRKNPKNLKQRKAGKNLVKKVSNVFVDKYPLDKPWVNDEIKQAHDKKVELANGLKGKKDDQLFAEFKAQRDTFVNLYEAARLEFIGKHPEEDVDKILTESDKPQTNAEQINPTENDSIDVANEKESIDVANANENANENPNETVTNDQSTTAISEASTNATECAAAT